MSLTREELQNQLNNLRTKWKVFPKSYLDKDWWKFKCDKCLALRLKEQIRKIDAGQEILADDLTSDQVEEIFK